VDHRVGKRRAADENISVTPMCRPVATPAQRAASHEKRAGAFTTTIGLWTFG
jgi:hypothetical protein